MTGRLSGKIGYAIGHLQFTSDMTMGHRPVTVSQLNGQLPDITVHSVELLHVVNTVFAGSDIVAETAVQGTRVVTRAGFHCTTVVGMESAEVVSHSSNKRTPSTPSGAGRPL